MKKKKISTLSIIYPNEKTNYFIISVLILGVITGSIFLIMLGSEDKNSVINQITTFFSNINENNINNGLALKNSLIINYTYIILIWILGLSMIGIILNIFITYIKGFILGFSLSSIILTYKYKSIPALILYIFPHQLINIILISTLSIYSIMFSQNLIKIIIGKSKNNKPIIKKYLIIFIFSIIISFISSIIEAYLFPNLLKIIISLYN